MFNALENSSRPRLQMLVIAIILLVLCGICYGPALNSPLNWDDRDWLTENPAVAHSNISWIWKHERSTESYYPLTLTSFWVEYHIWGLWLPGYRAVNIVLHAASAFLLWRILRTLKIPGALLAAIVWAIHPIQAETVVWLAERKNTLSGVFFFAGLLTWLRFIQPDLSRRGKIMAYAVTVVLLLGALFAKGSTVFFPVAALAIAWYYAGKLTRRDILASIPLFIAAGTMAAVTMYFEHHYASSGYGKEWDLSFAQRIILSGHTFWFYISKLVWPDQFALIYTRWELHADQPAEYVKFLAALLAMGATFMLAWRRNIRGPFAAMLIYLAGIFPVIGFFKFFTQLFTYVADHYVYLASAAFVPLVVAMIFTGWQWFRTRAASFQLPTWLAPIACLMLTLSLTLMTFGQSMLYRSTLSIWEETLRVTPTAWIAHNSIGQYLLDEVGSTEEALAHFEAGLKSSRDSRLLTNAGLALERMGRMAEARAYYDEAIANGVRFYVAYVRSALIAMKENNPKRAIELCGKALVSSPYEPQIWAVLGDAYQQDNQRENAVRAYDECLKLSPTAKSVHMALGDVLSELNRYPEAIDAYNQAKSLEPRNARIRLNLAAALRKLGREQEAAAEEKIGNDLVAQYNAATQARAASRPAPATGRAGS